MCPSVSCSPNSQNARFSLFHLAIDNGGYPVRSSDPGDPLCPWRLRHPSSIWKGGANYLKQALKRLPAEFRESLVLFEIEGWSYKAIAAALGVPVGTVMSRLSRARRRLQQELTNCQEAVPSGPDLNQSFGCAE